MFGFRHQTLFRSRWFALIWAAGICWLAVNMTTPDADADSNNSAAEQRATAEALGYNKAAIADMQNKLQSW
jgi:hypothetical protein